MRIAKRAGWILVGIVLGVIGTSSLGAVKPVAQAGDTSRLTVSQHSASIGNVAYIVAFIKDTKTDACWFVISRDSGVSVAPAPILACR